jgi:hypothetical protein
VRQPISADKIYKSRRPGAVPINVTLERDAVRLLRAYAPGPRAHGKFLSALLYEYDQHQGFRNLWEEARRDLQNLCQQVRQDMHRENGGE